MICIQKSVIHVIFFIVANFMNHILQINKSNILAKLLLIIIVTALRARRLIRFVSIYLMHTRCKLSK